jgi:hypothetical protein
MPRHLSACIYTMPQGGMAALGTKFPRFTSTKVQKLTQKALLGNAAGSAVGVPSNVAHGALPSLPEEGAGVFKLPDMKMPEMPGLAGLGAFWMGATAKMGAQAPAEDKK